MSDRLNTTAIREMAAARANDRRRRKESPGGVLTGTVPSLCDEVDRLRAEVEQLRELVHVGAELDNHHNAAHCPYCSPAPEPTPDTDRIDAIRQQLDLWNTPTTSSGAFTAEKRRDPLRGARKEDV